MSYACRMRLVVIIAWFLAACSTNDDLPGPVLASVSPDHAGIGATVTISGSYLCQQPEDGSGEVDPLACAHTGSVAFGVVPATVTQYTDTSVTAQVPDIAPGSTQISIAVGGRTTNGIGFTAVAAP